MFIPLNRRLAFIIWMTLSLFAFWVHELRAEPPRFHVDADAASVKIRHTFSGPVVHYPSVTLGRSVPLVRGAFKGRTADGAHVKVTVIDRKIADLDRDGIAEAALLIQERRCRNKVCVSSRRIDVWTMRSAGITRVVSHALTAHANETVYALQTKGQKLTILGKRIDHAADTESDITETFRYTSAILEPVRREIGEPYPLEGMGC